MRRHSRHIHCLRCQSSGKLCCVEAKEPYSNSSCQFLGSFEVWIPSFFSFCKEILSLLPCCPHLLQLSCCDRNGSSKLLRSPRCVKKNRVVGSPTWTVKTPCFGGKSLGMSFQASILGSIIFSHNHLWPVNQPRWQERRFSGGLIWWGCGLTGHDYRTFIYLIEKV